jgi:glutathione S-transferase
MTPYNIYHSPDIDSSYVLNLKGIAYKTVWLDYPDIEPELKKLGVEPSTFYVHKKHYTVPTVYDPNTKRAVTDSQPIAWYLDEQYPDHAPRLFPPGTRAFQAANIAQLFTILRNVVFPCLIYDMWRTTTSRSKPYIRETREEMFGCKLEDAAPQGEARSMALRQAKAFFDNLARAIKVNGDHALFLGDDVPSFADVDIASLLIWIRRTDGEAGKELWETIMSAGDGHWIKFVDTFKKWETVN